jgi:hypothetical protein
MLKPVKMVIIEGDDANLVTDGVNRHLTGPESNEWVLHGTLIVIPLSTGPRYIQALVKIMPVMMPGEGGHGPVHPGDGPPRLFVPRR